MEFNEKLQQLRKQKELTQEELAERLFVSRTAISKWESGRGLPNIDSLKAIASLFNVSIDDLLSANDIMLVAETEKKENAASLRTILYGLFDLMNLILLFVPLFAQKNGHGVEYISLLSMKTSDKYMFMVYIGILSMSILFGIVQITLQNYQNPLWKTYHAFISMVLSIISTIIFMMSLQPYLAFFHFWLLIMKGFIYMKQNK